jgi:hypothetical protein
MNVRARLAELVGEDRCPTCYSDEPNYEWRRFGDRKSPQCPDAWHHAQEVDPGWQEQETG